MEWRVSYRDGEVQAAGDPSLRSTRMEEGRASAGQPWSRHREAAAPVNQPEKDHQKICCR